jgi:Big-like domain-containing protein/leishmanolysin
MAPLHPRSLLLLAAGLAGTILGCGTEPPKLASLRVVSGNDQVGIVGRPLSAPLEVEADDEQGNPIEGVSLHFEVTQGAGQVTPAQSTTGGDGHATARFTLGSTPGVPQEVTVSGNGGQITASFVATATGVPTTVRLEAGNSQGAVAGGPVAIRPAVRVLDAAGRPVPGVAVRFAVTSGGGAVTGQTTSTDADGVAAVGAWRVGASGVNTLEATLPDEELAGEPVRFVATTITGPFNIVVRFLTEPTFEEAVAFAQAEVRWEQVIRGDLVNGSVDVKAGECGTGTPALNEVVDDVLILASFRNLDGPGNILAQAGPCLIRDANNDDQFEVGDLPGVGVMTFDAEDLDFVQQNGVLGAVVMHEMGHVLGIGSLWSSMKLLADPVRVGGSAADPHFTGTKALNAFDAAGGASYPDAKVPVENTGGAGTVDSHWRESIFDTELMTGFVDLTSNPLSAVTAASLADEGYQIDQTKTDAYQLPAAGLRAGARRPSIALPGDIIQMPIRGMSKVR